jgi:hypothetical protein
MASADNRIANDLDKHPHAEEEKVSAAETCPPDSQNGAQPKYSVEAAT